MNTKEILFAATLGAAVVALQVLQLPATVRTGHEIELVLWHSAMLAAAFGTAHTLERYVFRKWFGCSFLQLTGTRTALYGVAATGFALATVGWFHSLTTELHALQWSITYILWYSFVFLGITVAREVSRLAGKRAIDKLVLGRYHRPRNEERIFLFIDLKESTRLSKELPLEKYSMLIREFFRDIDTVMERHAGEIYQYAGDQVIVSWPAVAPNFDRAVLSFTEFHHRMKSRRGAYLQRYGIAPMFKAAMHSGTVVGTWMGRLKRELVFQGEVLNITARITALAKNLSYPVLLTEAVMRQLSPASRNMIVWGGKYNVKDLDEPIGIYFVKMGEAAISPTSPAPAWRPLHVTEERLRRDAMALGN